MSAGRHQSPAFLVFRGEGGYQRTFVLEPTAERFRIGRGRDADLRLAWDHEVSRVHAELERLGDAWLLIDDGLSANGTYVDGQRLRGRRRLKSGDEIRVGGTRLTFRAAPRDDDSETIVPTSGQLPVETSPMQRKVLIALARPCRDRGVSALPATNQQIAGELCLTVDAVKSHLHALFGKFAIGELPQNQKRARLVELAFERGNLGDRDFAA